VLTAGTIVGTWKEPVMPMTTVGDRYRVRVSDDGSVVGLWRISTA
jgi:hypothetical protein